MLRIPPRHVTLWLFVLFGGLLLLACGLAFAQDVTLPGVPAALTGPLLVMIGIVSGLLVQPLTAIAKRFGRTSGPSTVVVSGVLSLLLGLALTLWQAAVSHHGPDLPGALLVAVTAFAQANGSYIARVSAAAKGSGLAADALPPLRGGLGPTAATQEAQQPAPVPAEPASAPEPVAALASGLPLSTPDAPTQEDTMYGTNKPLALVSAVTGMLAESATTPITAAQAAQLASWGEQEYPVLAAAAAKVRSGDWTALFVLFVAARDSAQKLKGIFTGLDRAQIAAVLIRTVIRLELPEAAQSWATPILAGGVLESLLESAYLHAFGASAPVDLPSEVHTETPPPATVAAVAVIPNPVAPVTDAPELPSGTPAALQ